MLPPGRGPSFRDGPGHRIRLDVSSSNFPRFDVNPNTGEAIGRERRRMVADNTVFHEWGRSHGCCCRSSLSSQLSGGSRLPILWYQPADSYQLVYGSKVDAKIRASKDARKQCDSSQGWGALHAVAPSSSPQGSAVHPAGALTV